MGLLLLIVSIVGIGIFSPIGLVFGVGVALFSMLKYLYSVLNKYFLAMATVIDILGSVVMSPLFNLILIQKDGYKFGDPKKTISYVLGRNKLTGKLKPLGSWIGRVLNKIDPNHLEKAVENEES